MTRIAMAAVALAAIGVGAICASAARAEIVVTVDKATQRMAVVVDGEHLYTWPVSTGLGGTPSGTFRAQVLSRNHRSRIFNNAPMPYAIFYSGHYAIHGTTAIAQLGSRASKGCVRLHPSNAAVLFALVQKRGLASTRIVVQDSMVQAAQGQAARR
jgi:lipoprotein-anchoring transpeptidase ErfK/SrfK